MRIFGGHVRSIGWMSLLLVATIFPRSCLAEENRPILVGKIRNPSLLKLQGTFCDLHLLNDRQKRDIFLSAYQSQFQSKALMNIDGQDKVLTSVREVQTKRGSIATYRSGSLNVRVNYVRDLQVKNHSIFNSEL